MSGARVLGAQPLHWAIISENEWTLNKEPPGDRE